MQLYGILLIYLLEWMNKFRVYLIYQQNIISFVNIVILLY